MESFKKYLNQEEDNTLFFLRFPTLLESADSTRYSVEVNFRTTTDENLSAYAKIVLGYVSAGMKQHNFHIKHVYTEDPVRILVSSRNFDDGEWVVIVSWNPKDKCFIVSKGFYNKDRRTVSVQDSEKCNADNAAEITKLVFNMMHDLKSKPDNHMSKMKGLKLKTGPKR